MTKNFIPNKIEKKFTSFENIYVSKNTCILKLSDKNEHKKILKISPYRKDEYDTLILLKQADNKYLLKPEFVQKKNGFIYAIFPYKKTLIEYISSNSFTFINLFNLALDLCNGTIFLHEKKYLHLDISPDNIFLNEDNSFCIGDYSSVRKSNKKNKHDNLYLTPGYSPPEFNILPSNKSIINELSDEYSIGKTITSLYKTNNKTPDNNTIYIQENFTQIINKACSDIQTFRYPSVYELKDALLSLNKQYDIKTFNFKLDINKSDILFDNLKTLPVNQKSVDGYKNNIFSFFYTPAFMTIAILLAILLPTITLYNIFFVSDNFVTPQAEAISELNLPTESPTVYPKLHYNKKTPSSKPPVAFQLKEFDAQNNIITSLSAKTLSNIAGKSIDKNSLKILSANNNSITDITGITSFKNIEELYLSSNKIKNIEAVAELKNLKTLVLSANFIDNVCALSKVQTLENLDLSHNKKLKNITPLFQLKSLKLLCINDTGISSKNILKLKKELPYCEIVY